MNLTAADLVIHNTDRPHTARLYNRVRLTIGKSATDIVNRAINDGYQGPLRLQTIPHGIAVDAVYPALIDDDVMREMVYAREPAVARGGHCVDGPYQCRSPVDAVLFW